ncbi:hypothetical protein BRARA_B02743 [Brassica rapa]|uniref:Nucleoside diphosphate kinase n=1 Tax=Brassica campestris TaxID=3711 RepID=A0A398AK43_BRACM|nr:hypothetical protein BRARA_B02743 [Brassica rapa]
MSSQICRSASKAARSLLSSAKNARLFSEGRAIGAAAAVTASGKMPLYASNFARSSGSSKSWITGLLALPAAAFMVQDQEVFAAEMERTFIAIKPDGVQRGLKSEPGTIRGDLAVVVGRNIIHGSDGPETAKDEINLWFKPQELVSYTNNAEKWIYGDN